MGTIRQLEDDGPMLRSFYEGRPYAGHSEIIRTNDTKAGVSGFTAQAYWQVDVAEKRFEFVVTTSGVSGGHDDYKFLKHLMLKKNEASQTTGTFPLRLSTRSMAIIFMLLCLFDLLSDLAEAIERGGYIKLTSSANWSQ